MTTEKISVIRVGSILLVSVPAEPDDESIATIQDQVLRALERYGSKGLVLDISLVEILDSYFARTVMETVRMVQLMGGRTIISGMRPSVAITATQLGLNLRAAETALDMDRALLLLNSNSK